MNNITLYVIQVLHGCFKLMLSNFGLIQKINEIPSYIYKYINII